jgi:hypothetical protein
MMLLRLLCPLGVNGPKRTRETVLCNIAGCALQTSRPVFFLSTQEALRQDVEYVLLYAPPAFSSPAVGKLSGDGANPAKRPILFRQPQ